jgi:two-component system, cell cycle response regulator CpdR
VVGLYHAMSRRVLVVDDDPLMLDVTAATLEDLGCDVVTADAGPVALEKLAADERIEVLITDIQMPGMDGYELIEKARHRRPQLRVLACSGHPTFERGLPLIRKPFTQDRLARAMAKTTGLCD